MKIQLFKLIIYLMRKMFICFVFHRNAESYQDHLHNGAQGFWFLTFQRIGRTFCFRFPLTFVSPCVKVKPSLTLPELNKESTLMEGLLHIRHVCLSARFAWSDCAVSQYLNGECIQSVATQWTSHFWAPLVSLLHSLHREPFTLYLSLTGNN